jgi:bifunctional non-homologous end joining protein LigD
MSVGLREEMPRFVAPMLLAAADGVPDDDGWALEVKWDGMRAQARIEHRRLRVRSRRGVEWTQQFPELADLPPGAPDRSLLLDCELVCFGATGHPDFARLRGRLARGGSQADRAARIAPATLIVFDVLHLDGRAVRRLPYSRRRHLLAELALDGEHWRTPRAYRAGRDDLAAVTREHGLEGVVAKRLSAPYLEGRRAPGAWRKLKHRHVETLIVTAWEPGVGRGDELLVSRRDPNTGELRHAGRVPLRLSPGRRAAAQRSLAAIERPRRARGRVRLLEPVLAVDVAHHGRNDGAIRDPILKSFRPVS